MTAAPAVESVVTVERWANVVQLTWHPVEPPRPPMPPKPLVVGEVGKTKPTTRQYLRTCWRRSKLRSDLIERGWGLAIGLLIAAVVLYAHSLTGGIR